MNFLLINDIREREKKKKKKDGVIYIYKIGDFHLNWMDWSEPHPNYAKQKRGNNNRESICYCFLNNIF